VAPRTACPRVIRSQVTRVTRVTRVKRTARAGVAPFENMLVHGDNLEVLARLRGDFEAKFRCVYLDPPYNTGRRFREYTDARSPDAWRDMMRARLAMLHPLIAEDGAVFVEIDDTELGSLLTVMDEVFGRDQRIAIVTIVRSASVGHKTINRGPVNVTDYLLVYAKDRRAWRPNALSRPRAGRDAAYGLFLAGDPELVAGPSQWVIEPLGRVVARTLGYAGSAAASKGMGREAFERAIGRFSLDNARRVVRFAQPRYDAVSIEARRLIDRSRAEPDATFVLERPGFKPMILRGGNRLLFLSDKVRTVDGVATIVEPLTNVWDDIPFQGIAREGGVTFSRNKKPERLIERVLALSTKPGDWVLDPFLGSGTTTAVAHKMGRRWVGIESGTTFGELCVPRMERVVQGDDPAGVTRSVGWKGGGGFGVYA
jgi:adenine-specific DNA-methyltransferase